MKNSPFFSRIAISGAIFVSVFSHLASPEANAQNKPHESGRIDQLVEANYRKQGIEPNPPASDAVFLRRVYLDIIGRIPSKKEANSFLAYPGSDKRSRLIDHLLDSEGYVSHSFNFWADLLRAKSRMEGNSGGAYIDWIKAAIRDNKPYNEFVHELVDAEGKVWDNGAVGYYMRDSGMPLDNMSNTVRIFLGTRLECAQCHNHPFDKWTQMDYYKMAAFTYGVGTRVSAESNMGIKAIIDKDAKRRHPRYEMSRNVRRALGDILQPLSYGATESNRTVKLPADYAYDDKEPGAISPGVPFGDEVKPSRKKSKREQYADWLTGAGNPRFTTVVANRLWKRAMGVGLIEPVDNLMDTTKPSNPELMRFLEGVMRGGGYDIKRFQRIVYNTRTYQRTATVEEVPADTPYHFPGPQLRRMNAEQLWDSFVTLALPNPDTRSGSVYGRRGQGAKERAEKLAARSPQSIIDQALVIGAAEDVFEAATDRIRKEMLVAGEADDSERLKALRKEMGEANKVRRDAIAAANKAAASGMGDMSMMDKMAMKREEEMVKKNPKLAKKDKPNDPWAGYGRHLMRASEVQSPAPGGHFLREFGQSDRELIENSHKDTSVAQALSLLNGPVTRDVLGGNSVLKKQLAADMDADAKIDTLFLSILTRKPTEGQREMARRQIESNPKTGIDNLIWALMNTSEFAFVQ